jgi:hypothetical protein
MSMREYFELGTKLAKQHGPGAKVLQKFREANRRSVQIKMLRPDPEIARDVPGWLKLYVEGRLKPGAVAAEAFCVYLDPTSAQIQIVDSWQVKDPTVTFYIEEQAAQIVAARTETVYTAWIKGWPIRLEVDHSLRDVALVDEILNQYYRLALEAGHDLAALFK